MKKRTYLALFMALTMLTMALVACAGSSSGDKDSPPPAANPETPGNTVQAENSGESGLSGSLVYWSMWNDTERQAQVIKSAAEAFMDENPGVKIELVFNGRDNKNIIAAALDGGQQIDLFDLASVDYTMTNFAGYVLDLTDYFEASYPTTNGKSFEACISPALIEILNNLTDDGRYYMVPYQLSAFMWMYNKDHFEAAGITSAPETWDEFLDVCEKLKTAGYTPITSDGAYLDNNFGMHLTRLKGTDWVYDLVNDSTNAMWEDSAVMTALEDYQELRDKGYLADTIASNIYPAGQQEVALGEVSMYWNGTWLVNEVMDVAGEEFNWGSFSYPTIDGAGSQYDLQMSGQGLCVSNKSENADLAFEFIAYLFTTEWDSELAAATYGIPNQPDGNTPVQLNDAVQYISNATSRIVNNTNIRANADKLAVVQDAFLRLLSGEYDAQQAADAMKK